MADDILELPNVTLTRFAGGVARGRCYQVTTSDGRNVEMTEAEALRVANAVLIDVTSRMPEAVAIHCRMLMVTTQALSPLPETT